MNEEIVITALQASVVTSVAQSITPTLPVKYLNVTFVIPNDGKWLELVHIPNPPTDQTWGDEKIFRGLFRMLLHWPNDGAGAINANKLADSIMAGYSKSVAMNGVLRLMNQPRLSNFIEEEKGTVGVITLEYSSFSP